MACTHDSCVYSRHWHSIALTRCSHQALRSRDSALAVVSLWSRCCNALTIVLRPLLVHFDQATAPLRRSSRTCRLASTSLFRSPLVYATSDSRLSSAFYSLVLSQSQSRCQCLPALPLAGRNAARTSTAYGPEYTHHYIFATCLIKFLINACHIHMHIEEQVAPERRASGEIKASKWLQPSA